MSALGRSIGAAQTEIDRSALLLQRVIDADAELAMYGVQATWYQIPSSQIEIKAALSIAPASSSGVAANKASPTVNVSPLNPQLMQQFGFDPLAASTVRFTLVPVPPRTTDALQTPPALSDRQAMELAASALQHEPGSATMALAGTRVVATFNPAVRKWYVVQFRDDQGQVTTLAVIEVDDTTKKITKR